MVRRNPNFQKLKSNYLFVEIANRRKAFSMANKEAKLISLGIGDTTEPLPLAVVEGFMKKANQLGTKEGYTGYPDYNGSQQLRQLIVESFYKGLDISADEIFISDGSKPDLARLQLLLGGAGVSIAVQNPVYPAYVDGTVISGKAGDYNEQDDRYTNITYMSCTPDNGFFPDLCRLTRTDVIFFCSPNNPTGTAATQAQLEQLVMLAKQNKSLIIFDSAYSGFITDENVVPSIYAIKGAKEVALETSSLSKLIGFTGVRLGWTVCPRSIRYEDETPLWDDWSRIMGTCFNGACSLAEAGAMAALSVNGRIAMREMTSFYLENASIIKEALEEVGFECYGGRNGPYIWVRVAGKDSWDVFQEFLQKAHVVVTPGAGFGSEGKSFIRVSAFAHREDVVEAVKRIKNAFIIN